MFNSRLKLNLENLKNKLVKGGFRKIEPLNLQVILHNQAVKNGVFFING